MNATRATKIGRSLGSATLGAMYGALFAALCNHMSGSLVAGGVIVVVAALLGAWLGRFSGLILGSIYGVLFAALADGIGGSTSGVALAILGCAVLGGWLQWIHDLRLERRTPRQDHDRTCGSRTLASGHRRAPDREMVLCN